MCFYFCKCVCVNHYLHSFPPRRSSDLDRTERRPEPSRRVGRRTRPPRFVRQPHHHQSSARRNRGGRVDRKSTRLNSSHVSISYAVFCLKKKKYLLPSCLMIVIIVLFHY